MKKLLCVLLALLLPAAANAQTIVLPQNTTEIGPEAFRGDTSIVSAVIPEGTTSIGTSAFADCSALQKITIPSSVVTIGTGVFTGCPSSLLISTTAGSAAMLHAASSQIDYQAGTTYRALLIGQCAYDTGMSSLEGPAYDVAALSEALKLHDTTPYECKVYRDLTASALVSAVSTTFAGAQAQDVSLFYYSGHGASGGKLVGVDRMGISAASLRTLLDRIPGRKIVIVDACHSGGIIGRSAESSAAEDFASEFLSAFNYKTRSNLATDGYYVITAAHSSEESLEMTSGGKSFGLFTRYLCEGLGYDYLNDRTGEVLADTNGDGVISIHEAYNYANIHASELAAKYSREQNAQVYPDNCTYQSLVRK